MAERFDLIVFDWDGTLMDSAAEIVRAMQAAAIDLGHAPPSDERARYVIGLGLADALRHAVPTLAEAEHPRMVERYRHHYLSKDHALTLFEGVVETIQALHARGQMLAVATGKSRLGLNRALEYTGLGPYFHVTRCADETFSKPHPAMLEYIMDSLGVPPDRTLMVGDTTHDLQMARNACTSALAVGFGAHPAHALKEENPLALVHTPWEMSSWLLEQT